MAQSNQNPPERPQQQAVVAERQIPGANLDTTLTEETADQLARGVSPVSDDASADAERAVADEPTPAAHAMEAEPDYITIASLSDRVKALEDDVAKLRAQLRHSL